MVQEAYLRAYRGLKRFRGDAPFTTWLYRITANCASTQLGRRARTVTTSSTRRRADVRRPAPRQRSRGPGRGRGAERPGVGGARACRRASGRSSCCGTSTTCRTRRSPQSWASARRRPRSGSTGPGAAAGPAVPDRGARRAGGGRPMRCDAISADARRQWSTAPPCSTRRGPRHVSSCLRCQAELAHYRGSCAPCASSATSPGRCPADLPRSSWPPAGRADAAVQPVGPAGRRRRGVAATAAGAAGATSWWPAGGGAQPAG